VSSSCYRGRRRIPLTNQDALEALQRCRDEAERRALREQLVRNNLPLVYAVTARMGRTLALPQEDLRQIGSLGLLRAIDAYEPSRGRTLSSFAVPYIRGAIQHELRDRASLMRIPRPLWELRRRATVLQDRRRRLGQPQLAPAQLAEALDCSASQVLEALQVGAVVDMRSLDAPSSGEWGDDSVGRTLLERLPDPASLVEATPDDTCPQAKDRITAEPTAQRDHDAPPTQAPVGWPSTPERFWLQQRLKALTAQERQLLEGHACLGRSWAELGRELGLHPRQAQRRTVALLSRLEAEGRRWRDAAADGLG
jgi:RNA polymerase sigma-B factor